MFLLESRILLPTNFTCTEKKRYPFFEPSNQSIFHMNSKNFSENFETIYDKIIKYESLDALILKVIIDQNLI